MSPYTLNSATCECGTNSFVNAADSVCTACHYSCLTCDGTATTNCLTCDAGDEREPSGSQCVCLATFKDVGNKLCQQGDCQTGYALNAGVCVEVCGDGRRTAAECDDGNTVSGDGCSASCTVEQNYTCAGSPSSPSVCSYNQALTVTLVDSWKDPTANTVYFSFSIFPAIPALNSLSFLESLSCSLPNTTLGAKYDGNGNLLVTAEYASSIQSLLANLTFTPSASSSFFFATPDSITPFAVDPNNNLAAVYYDDTVYDSVATVEKLAYATAGLGYAGCLAGLFVGRFISVEMIGVVQVAFVGLIVLDYMQPLLAPLARIGFVNGVNSLFADQKQSLYADGTLAVGGVPRNVAALSYDSQMAYSLNYSVALLLLPPLVALALLAGSRIAKDEERRGKLRRWAWTALCDFGLSAVVFLLYQVVTSLLVWAVYSKSQGALFPFSIVDAVVSLAVTAGVLVLFRRRPEHFGDFRGAFKPDALSQQHYYVLTAGRVLLAALLVATCASSYAGFVCLLVPLGSLVFLALRRPYRHGYNNGRAILNASVDVLVLAVYGYYRCFVPYPESFSGLNGVLPYFVVGLLLVCMVVNIAILVKYALDKCSESGVPAQSAAVKLDEPTNAEFMQEMLKEISKFQQKKLLGTRQFIYGKVFNP